MELLSPVGDFDCLKAAVQNGADAVYFGGALFNARVFAKNFDDNELKEAIRYAKLRNVKVNFTLNTLIKNEEMSDAIEIAEYIYELGADAIIVQDLGLAKYIIDNLKGMDVHASTQMSIHNLQGALEMQNLGFKRVVLARELTLHDIEYICNHTEIEIETFIHGALCISYSGQCLLSSAIGGRSGNRGKCAQPCRLPYELIKEDKISEHHDIIRTLDKGYILSPKDLCGLEYIPSLMSVGVSSIKIEGRMKPSEYVSSVTKIYRKYIDMAQSGKPYKIEEEDIKELKSVFNRGGFSKGNFEDEPNKEYIYKEKPNNIGLYVGNISKVNEKKGYVTLKTTETLKIGDHISFEKENHKYTISELMKLSKNIEKAMPGDTIVIGRMKGNLKLGDKIYKLTSISNKKKVINYINQENKKIMLSCKVNIKRDRKISIDVKSLDKKGGTYYKLNAHIENELIPKEAINEPITAERIRNQINKTTNTQFDFEEIQVDLDDNLFIQRVSAINDLRREALESLEHQAIKNFERTKQKISTIKKYMTINELDEENKNVGISLILNEIDTENDYSMLHDVKNVYIPLRFFLLKEYHDVLQTISKKFKIYIYFPTIIKDNFRNLFFNNLNKYIEEYSIKGLVISNISALEFIENYIEKLDIVAKYSLNIFNNYSLDVLKNKGINRVWISPELTCKHVEEIAKNAEIETEFMVYGALPVMNNGYCFLGHSNKCYPTCQEQCKQENAKYYLKDRLGLKFRVIPDNLQTITTIYNSKITSISYKKLGITNCIVSILDEDIEKINNVIDNVKNDEIFIGKEYTNGNFNREV